MLKDINDLNQQQYQQLSSQIRQKIQTRHLIADQHLTTLNITQIIDVKAQALDMVFYYMPALATKIQATQSHQHNQHQHQHQVKFNPFINPDKSLLIEELGQRHRLLFNKYNIYRNHLLVITKQYESQLTKITQGDMVNAALIVHALDGILFFNGGLQAGASQEHKHLQILPSQAKSLPIFKKMHHFIQNYQTNSSNYIIKFQPFNFMHGIVKIQINQHQKSHLGKRLLQAYNTLYSEFIEKSEGKYIYYNLVACDSFLLMAVRKKEHAFQSISVNSLGFMGSLLFRDPQVMEQFKNTHSPSSILEDICEK